VARYQAQHNLNLASQVIETAMVSLVLIGGVLLLALYLPLKLVLPQFFKPDQLAKALEIIPYALLSLWLTMVASVAQSGIDGCQRMDLRAIIAVASQGLLLLLAFILVPRYGLVGLACAQIYQGLFLLLVNWFMLRKVLAELPLLPYRWNRAVFREIFVYGMNMQFATLFMLLFDPLTKGLLARFGGASAAGYFEMANQVSLKIRALFIAANQAIVPKVAQLSETAPHKLKSMYIDNFRAMIFISLPAYALIVSWGNFISGMLTGQHEPLFLFFLQVNVVGWFFNTICSPAYFANMGRGRIGLNLLAHAVMGMLNLALGLLLGNLIGVEGVAVAYVISLMIGSIILIIVYHERSGITWDDLKLKSYTGLAFSSVVAITIGCYSTRLISIGNWVYVLATFVVAPIMLLVAFLRNAYFQKILAIAKNKFGY
jgi:O-antigen/teichoic acid export membrane protein